MVMALAEIGADNKSSVFQCLKMRSENGEKPSGPYASGFMETVGLFVSRGYAQKI